MEVLFILVFTNYLIPVFVFRLVGLKIEFNLYSMPFDGDNAGDCAK
jgi:hypothetical protein